LKKANSILVCRGWLKTHLLAKEAYIIGRGEVPKRKERKNTRNNDDVASALEKKKITCPRTAVAPD